MAVIADNDKVMLSHFKQNFLKVKIDFLQVKCDKPFILSFKKMEGMKKNVFCYTFAIYDKLDDKAPK